MNYRSLFFITLLMVCSVNFKTAFSGEIHDAAIRGNLDQKRTILAANPTMIDTKNAQGCSPLFLSLDRGRTRTAIWLLENGASWRSLGNRAAAMAVRVNCPQALELMLAAGAPADSKDRQGLTPLLQVVRNNRPLQLARILIENGSDPNDVLPGGTPLIVWAAATGQKSTVKTLLAGGADATTKDPQGRKALELAASHGHSETASLIAEATKMSCRVFRRLLA